MTTFRMPFVRHDDDWREVAERRRMLRLMDEHGERFDLARLGEVELSRGGHEERRGGLCLMELVAWAAGEAHSFLPVCCCPLLTAIGNALNDALPDHDRQRLKMLVPYLVDSASYPVSQRINPHAEYMQAVHRRHLGDWRHPIYSWDREFFAKASREGWPDLAPYYELADLAPYLGRASARSAVQWYCLDPDNLAAYLDHLRELCFFGRPQPTEGRAA